MDTFATLPLQVYFPAIFRAECDSPIDALVALRIPRQEAMDIVAASWGNGESSALIAITDGGRPVVALLTPEGRWAACNAFLGNLCATHQEADRRLSKVLKRHHRGYVASVPSRQMTSAAEFQTHPGCRDSWAR
ncbi:MAG: hypothetical protein IPJ27_08705 [Candidatus Accumulibacter sp.]|uniref:Uncharacterized protein n=1 Tax=Candidatus Accumulibacter proximus TaxID=2954385 RepID=A0A935PWV7_9PROT|nr:hypothetical protein [Candidatus Accumulibacter proximus]